LGVLRSKIKDEYCICHIGAKVNQLPFIFLQLIKVEGIDIWIKGLHLSKIITNLCCIKNTRMKKFLFILSAICLFTACRFKSGSGEIITQHRNLENFTGIDVGGDFDVEINTGSSTKVTVEADNNIIDDIETSTNAGQLKISVKEGIQYNNVHMKIFITAPEINKIQSAASADVIVKDWLKSNGKIIFKASSGSSIKASVDAPNTDSDASSGADIILSGRTQNLLVEASSGASVKAYELLSENTNAQTSSGAKAEVHASVKLQAKASSGGNISYRGNPSVVRNESSGGAVEKNNK
jgi:hypothetical protein